MVVRFVQWTLDVQDVHLMAEFWSQALGFQVDFGDDGSAKLYPSEDTRAGNVCVWLQPTTEPKRGKNRNHPDLRPQDGDVEAEVQRLVALGAQHTDIGQTDDDPFVVLVDPEGNEFCVLRREPGPA
jgi:Glyoxalase-like domain